MRRRATTLSLLLALAPLAAQDLGADAPEIEWSKTFHFEGMPTAKLTELRGSVVLLAFWATQSSDCRRIIPRLNELHGKYAARGLVVLGVSTDPADEVEKYVGRYEVAYPVAIGLRNEYRVRLVPYSYLIDMHGKIVWRGNPADVDEDQLGKLVVGAKPGTVRDGLGDVYRLRFDKKNGDAYKLAGELLQAGTLSEAAQAQAKGWRTDDEQAVVDALQAAEAAERDGDVFVLWRNLDAVVNRYAGVPGGDGAKARLDKLLENKKNQREVDAGQQLEAGEAKEAAFDFDGAHEIYKQLARRLGSTKAGKVANQRYKDIEKQGKLGYDHNCNYCKAGGAACPQHKKDK